MDAKILFRIRLSFFFLSNKFNTIQYNKYLVIFNYFTFYYYSLQQYSLIFIIFIYIHTITF